MTLTGLVILLVVVMLFSFFYKVFTGMVNEIIDEYNKLSGND
jgi:preprotein translocase subunit SecY